MRCVHRAPRPMTTADAAANILTDRGTLMTCKSKDTVGDYDTTPVNKEVDSQLSQNKELYDDSDYHKCFHCGVLFSECVCSGGYEDG